MRAELASNERDIRRQLLEVDLGLTDEELLEADASRALAAGALRRAATEVQAHNTLIGAHRLSQRLETKFWGVRMLVEMLDETEITEPYVYTRTLIRGEVPASEQPRAFSGTLKKINLPEGIVLFGPGVIRVPVLSSTGVPQFNVTPLPG